MNNILETLPRLPTESMTPCVCCGQHLVETGLPLFVRINARRCGIDNAALRERIGLAMMMGGASALPLAGVFASRDPVVVMDDLGDFNVCCTCLTRPGMSGVMLLLAMVQERRDEPALERQPVGEPA